MFRSVMVKADGFPRSTASVICAVLSIVIVGGALALFVHHALSLLK
jgi:hypothetical protein